MQIKVLLTEFIIFGFKILLIAHLKENNGWVFYKPHQKLMMSWHRTEKEIILSNVKKIWTYQNFILQYLDRLFDFM